MSDTILTMDGFENAVASYRYDPHPECWEWKSKLIAHDAALRRQVEELTRERDELRAEVEMVSRVCDAAETECDAAETERDALRARLDAMATPTPPAAEASEVEALARELHDTYEECASVNGWRTRASCRIAFDNLPIRNRATMRALAASVLRREAPLRAKVGELTYALNSATASLRTTCDLRQEAHLRAERAEAERDALRARLDAMATREPTQAEIVEIHEGLVAGGWSLVWRKVRDRLLAETAKGEATTPPAAAASEVEGVWVVFDGPPSHEGPRFIEVENAARVSVRPSFAEWTPWEAGYWALGPFYTHAEVLRREAALRERAEAAEAELTEANEATTHWQAQYKSQCQRAERAEAEVSRLRADRERLDWVEKNWRDAMTTFNERVCVWEDGMSLRDAIDAASAKEKP